MKKISLVSGSPIIKSYLDTVPNVVNVVTGKGGNGKTPISSFIAEALFSIIWTNDNDLMDVVNSSRGCMVISMEKLSQADFKEFPSSVIDSGGHDEVGYNEVIRKSDLCIVPINASCPSSLKRGVISAIKVCELNPNVIIVATMLERKGQYEELYEYIKELPIKAYFPLKKTNIFKNAFFAGVGVDDYMKGGKNVKGEIIYDEKQIGVRKSYYKNRKKDQKEPTILEQIETITNYIKGVR